MSDGAATPLTSDEEAALRTDLRVAGPHDFPQRGLVARLLETLDVARSQPAGLDVERLARAMENKWDDVGDSGHDGWIADPESFTQTVAAEYARLADGPGPA